jgi:FixJ family two-component response regulator
VFVIDPDESVRQALARLIDAEGMRARPCVSIDDLPDTDIGGHDVCVLVDCTCAPSWSRALEHRFAELSSRVPVVAIADSHDDTALRAARRIGAQSYFRKPIDGPALVDAVRWALGAGAPSDDRRGARR